ncbi:hypothetical protein [Actinomadura sp. WMMB 499]|uniref:hypothetical protein n=1 Tax=Actinomadura sp. WMMB 499 TaxID=1219491 RepID=UPI0012480CDE|nr:hypothetical protein [Actinomadura sp. WMMB 499]QFG23875.1 hypothetical protein F7P10_24915 [Actinomadura sp. WMMB 499]
MTMLGRGKRSAADKSSKDAKDAKGAEDPEKELTKDEAAEKAREAEGKARRAAEQAAKAEEAAEAARLAEEAAARAKEAARLAKIAADAASADAEADAEADEGDEDGAEPDENRAAATTPRKKRDGGGGSDLASEGEEGSADESAAPAGVSVEDGTGAEEDAEDDSDAEEDAEDDSDSEEDAEEDAEDEPGETGDGEAAEPARSSGRSSGRRGSPAVIVGVLTVLAVALAAGTVFLGMKYREHQAIEEARADGVSAASDAVKALSSYDYRTLDNDLKSAEAITTGDLNKEFPKFASQLKAQARQQEAVSTTTVLKAGAVSVSPEKVVALVYANRIAATNKDTQARLPEPLRVKATMVKADGEWKAEDVDVIS